MRSAAYFIRGVAPLYFEAESKRLGFEKLPVYFHGDGWDYLRGSRPVRWWIRELHDVPRDGDGRPRWRCPTSRCRKCTWDNLTKYHLYITGGVGSEWAVLPTLRPAQRARVCAGIGLVFWARRMLDLELRGAYADVMERSAL